MSMEVCEPGGGSKHAMGKMNVAGCVCVCFNSFLYNRISKQSHMIREYRYPKCQRERYITENIKYVSTDLYKTPDSIQSGQGYLTGICSHFFSYLCS